MNITGEKLHLNHCLSAIEKLQAECELRVCQFRIAPDMKTRRYEFFLAMRHRMSETSSHETLLDTLDNCLCESNIEYASRRRSDGSMHHASISCMKPGSMRQTPARRGDVQYKWQQLATEKLVADMRCIRFTIQKGDLLMVKNSFMDCLLRQLLSAFLRWAILQCFLHRSVDIGGCRRSRLSIPARIQSV